MHRSALATSPAPWSVVVHFSGFPTAQLVRTGGVADLLQRSLQPEAAGAALISPLRSLFQHSVKQALYLLHGSTRIFAELSAVEREQLWQHGCLANGAAHGNALKKLLPLPSSAYRSGKEDPSGRLDRGARVPIRIVFGAGGTSRPVQHWPWPAVQSEETGSSPNDHCAYCLSEGKGETSKNCVPDTLENVVHAFLLQAKSGTPAVRQPVQVLVQGVQVPLHAPIARLWRLFHSADLFLYLLLRE
jgi:hypothetical protein